MRKIKFRAWDKLNKKMIVWDDCCGSMEKGSLLSYPDNYAPMQCTGLNDNNVEEIYEGDILESKYKHQAVMGKHMHAVEWSDKWNGWNFKPELIDSFKMSIIGNIYENPELLEESND